MGETAFISGAWWRVKKVRCTKEGKRQTSNKLAASQHAPFYPELAVVFVFICQI
jgi:hypothetical protein